MLSTMNSIYLLGSIKRFALSLELRIVPHTHKNFPLLLKRAQIACPSLTGKCRTNIFESSSSVPNSSRGLFFSFIKETDRG